MSGKGSADLEAYGAGKTLTRDRTIKAKCYECMADYHDGRMDCKIPKCPLYPFMPYRGKREEWTPSKGLCMPTRCPLPENASTELPSAENGVSLA